MDSETLDISHFSTTSSWPIIRGSLDDVVSCESSISAVDSDSDHAVATTRKPPLILRRPSPDSSPCEITILFTQQHEIRQVYVRSTAKVYEIYYAADEKGGNEYLCTVRCGIAARDEELRLESDGAGSFSTGSSGSSKDMDEGHSRTESGSSTNEDGWVDVKLQNSSRVDTGDKSLLNKDGSCMVQEIQDCFEATAEISDADPVWSITLRLLSIQSGDIILIDEVYVFADTVASTDINSSATTQESSSGGALLSMFLPTLLQMSKSRTSKSQEYSGSAAGERCTNRDNGQNSTGAAVTSSTPPQTQNMPSTMLEGASVYKCQPELPIQAPYPPNRPHLTCRENDFPCSKIERTLDELVSRLSKIEDFCLRFEENMSKPIINMEARLERVEKQLESFIMNPQFPRTGCTRYSAPEFSCNESESNSIHTSGTDCPGTTKSESSKKDDSCLQELSIPFSEAYPCPNVQLHDVQSSTSASQSLPGLVVTAPDFSYIDDEEENDCMEAVKDTPKDSFKKSMSINDALASALAGFVSSALTKPLECTDMVEEAEFFSGIEGSGDTSPSALSAALTKPFECTEMVEEAENISSIDGNGNTCLPTLIQSDERLLPSVCIDEGDTSNEDAVVTGKESFLAVSAGEETTGAFDGEGGSKNPLGSSDSSSVDGLGITEKCDSIAGTGCPESGDDAGQTFVSDYYDAGTLVDSALSNDVSVAAVEVPGGQIDSSSGEGIANERPAVLQDIIELPSTAMIDFNVPVLDVKFSSLDSSSAMSFLEALLVDMPDVGSEAPCVRGGDASSFNEQPDLVVIENEESGDSNNQLLCFDNFNSAYMLSETEGELQEHSNCSNQEMCASLI